MNFNLNLIKTRQVQMVVAKVNSIERDSRDNLLLFVTELDLETGDVLEDNTGTFNISTYGLVRGFNYSVGECFGATADYYQNEVACFDLGELIGCEVVFFIHKKVSQATNQEFQTVMDLFPLIDLQFPWLVDRYEEPEESNDDE